MKKALVWIVIILVIVVGAYLSQSYWMPYVSPAQDTAEEVTMEEEMIEESAMTGNVVQPTDGGETGVDPEFMEQLEAQAGAEAAVEGEELTDEDIKLIEDILQQITDSVQE